MKRRSRKTRAERIFNENMWDSYHHKELVGKVGKCNYYDLTNNKNFLREENSLLTTSKRMASTKSPSTFSNWLNVC